MTRAEVEEARQRAEFMKQLPLAQHNPGYIDRLNLLEHCDKLTEMMNRLWTEIDVTFPASYMDQPLLLAMRDVGDALGKNVNEYVIALGEEL